MAQDKVISWAEYQSRKAIEKAANLDAKAATSPTALAKTSEAFYVPSAGSSKTKKMPKDYDFEADGTSSKKYPENRNNSYPQAKASYGYGNFDSYQKGGAKTPVGVYERCFTKHPPLKIVVKDKEYFIYGGSCSDPVVKDADIYVGFERGMKETT